MITAAGKEQKREAAQAVFFSSAFGACRRLGGDEERRTPSQSPLLSLK